MAFEVWMFCYLMPFEKLEALIINNNGEKTPKFFKWALNALVMVICLGLFVFASFN